MVDIEKEYEFVISDHDNIVTKTDSKGLITFLNDDFIWISKYTCKNVIGNKHDIFRHPDIPKDVFDNLWRTILDECTWTGIVKNKKNDGGLYWVQADVTPIYVDNKWVGFMSVRHKSVIEDVKKVYIPEKDKIEVIVELLKINPELPIIVISGGLRASNAIFNFDSDSAAMLGARGVLQKPFTYEQLLEMIDSVLGE
jgi:PAS domain S-box-containing protein